MLATTTSLVLLALLWYLKSFKDTSLPEYYIILHSVYCTTVLIFASYHFSFITLKYKNYPFTFVAFALYTSAVL